MQNNALGDSGAVAWFRRALLLGPIWYVTAVAYIIAHRITYPFELEWLEGGSWLEVLRLLERKPLYTAPSLSYIAFNYPPLYFYISALAAWLSGDRGLTALRVVSLAATLGSGFVVYRIVLEQSGSRFWGIISVGLFAAGFRVGGYWFDIGRVDMLFIFLFLAATYALWRNGRHSGFVAGGLFALAFYTKQSALLLVCAVGVWLLARRAWQQAIQIAIAFGGLSLVFILLEDHLSGGWYNYYVFQLPVLHHFPSPLWATLFSEAAALLAQLGVGLIVGGAALLVAKGRDRDRIGFFTVICLAAFVVSVLGNAEPAGFDNANLPAVATVPILAALGMQTLESAARLSRPALVRLTLYGLLVLQFCVLGFAIRPQLPTAADREAGEQIVNSLRATPGEVLVPFHPYLAVMAGKQPSAHQIMLWVLSGNFGEVDEINWPRIAENITILLKARAFSRIMLDRTDAIWRQVPVFYLGDQIPYAEPDVFYPVTGGQGRPNLNFVPR